MTQDQFERITKWAEVTFPKATTTSKLAHLEEEVKELKDAQGESKKEEFADCIMLLYHAMHGEGMNYGDICEVIEQKFAVVKQREWHESDENGVVRHRRAK